MLVRPFNAAAQTPAIAALRRVSILFIRFLINSAGMSLSESTAAPRPPSGQAAAPATPVQDSHAALAIGVIALAAFSGALMQSLVVPLLAQFPGLLGTDATTASWLVTAMLLSGAVSNVIFGRLGDMFGKRRIILVCLAFLVLGSLIGTVTHDVGWLIVARALQGVAIAVVPLGISCLGELMGGTALVKGITLISAMAGIGASLGFTISAAVAQYFDWHVLFGLSAVLGAVSMLGVLRYIPPRPGSGERAIDLAGAAGITLGLAGMLLGVSKGSQWGWDAPLTWACLAGGMLVLLLWGWHQLSIAQPLVALRTAAQRPILFTNLATIMVGFAMYGTVLTQPQLIQLPVATGHGLGRSVLVAGLSFLPGALVALLLPGLAARITARHGVRFTMRAGALSLAAGYGLFLLFHADLFSLMLANVFVAGGASICYGAAPTLIMRHAPAGQAGQANGLNNLARSIGTSSSSAVSAALLAGLVVLADGREYPSELAFMLVFAISGVASLMICALLAFVPERDTRRSP